MIFRPYSPRGPFSVGIRDFAFCCGKALLPDQVLPGWLNLWWKRTVLYWQLLGQLAFYRQLGHDAFLTTLSLQHCCGRIFYPSAKRRKTRFLGLIVNACLWLPHYCYAIGETISVASIGLPSDGIAALLRQLLRHKSLDLAFLVTPP